MHCNRLDQIVIVGHLCLLKNGSRIPDTSKWHNDWWRFVWFAETSWIGFAADLKREHELLHKASKHIPKKGAASRKKPASTGRRN
jgi:hypothetical protein